MNEFIRKMGRKEGEVRVIKECPDSRNKVREGLGGREETNVFLLLSPDA
jgi:hypothetical protein